MKKNDSVIDLRMAELRRHYLIQTGLSFFLPLLFLFALCAVYLIPQFVSVPYETYLSAIYETGGVQIAINVLIVIVSLLLSFLVMLIVSFFGNRKYQEFYRKILFDELKLYDFTPNFENDYLSAKNFDAIYRLSGIGEAEREFVLSLKKEYDMNLYQLRIPSFKKKNAALIVLDTDMERRHFFRIGNGTLGKNAIEGADEPLALYYYDQADYSEEFQVLSGYGKRTNAICDRRFLKEFDRLQRYAETKISVISFQRFTVLLISGWKINLSHSFLKRGTGDELDMKIQSFKRLYEHLCRITADIIERGEANEKK